ncbi:hypothetical protein BGZ46_005943, partial [Entomortierella lignicola]
MSDYGTVNAAAPASAGRRDEESQRLLHSQTDTEANDTFYGRTFGHVSTHRNRYFALWVAVAIIAITTVVGLHYYEKEHGGHLLHPYKPEGEAKLINGVSRPEVCESDRSYPIAILLSIFLGYVGVDRFYLGYIISSILKLVT